MLRLEYIEDIGYMQQQLWDWIKAVDILGFSTILAPEQLGKFGTSLIFWMWVSDGRLSPKPRDWHEYSEHGKFIKCKLSFRLPPSTAGPLWGCLAASVVVIVLSFRWSTRHFLPVVSGAKWIATRFLEKTRETRKCWGTAVEHVLEPCCFMCEHRYMGENGHGKRPRKTAHGVTFPFINKQCRLGFFPGESSGDVRLC